MTRGAMSGSRSKKTGEKLPRLFSAWEWRFPASHACKDPAQSDSEQLVLEMGVTFEVTRERIRSIEARELRKLKKLRRVSTDDDDPPPAAALALTHPRALLTLDVRGSTTSSTNRGRCSPVPSR